MHKNNSKAILLYLLLASICTFPALAIAKNEMPDGRNEEKRVQKETMLEEKQENRLLLQEQKQEVREEKVKNKCENIGERIKLKIERYNTNRERYVERYADLNKRILGWVDRLDKDGYDVTELKSALTVLDTKISKLRDVHETFITSLNDIQQNECGNSDGAYAKSLATSREALTAVRDAVLDIRKYYIEEVKPLVIDLRNQVAKDKADTTETETTDSESNE